MRDSKGASCSTRFRSQRAASLNRAGSTAAAGDRGERSNMLPGVADIISRIWPTACLHTGHVDEIAIRHGVSASALIYDSICARACSRAVGHGVGMIRAAIISTIATTSQQYAHVLHSSPLASPAEMRQSRLLPRHDTASRPTARPARCRDVFRRGDFAISLSRT